jgi:5'-3' exonuclease
MKKYQVKSDYVYLAVDHKITWRKRVFPQYKANRKKSRDKSGVDFEKLFSLMNSFYIDLKTVFPFHFIQTKYAEGDDIIGFLARHFSELNEDFVIVSSDSDFIQLHCLPGFRGQYDPVGKNIKSEKPKRDLYIKILNGDPGDGIPNVLSDDDTFVVEGKRQKKLGEVKADSILTSGVKEWLEENNAVKNFKRNQRLIDLSKTPEQIQKKILMEYVNSKPNRDRMKLEAYFHANAMVILQNRAHEF